MDEEYHQKRLGDEQLYVGNLILLNALYEIMCSLLDLFRALALGFLGATRDEPVGA